MASGKKQAAKAKPDAAAEKEAAPEAKVEAAAPEAGQAEKPKAAKAGVEDRVALVERQIAHLAQKIGGALNIHVNLPTE